MRGLVRCEPVQRLHALPLRRDGAFATALIRRDDDVNEPLEEVAFLLLARAPRELEFLVRLEERAAACEGQPLLVAPSDSANVGVSDGNDPAARGRPLHQGEA